MAKELNVLKSPVEMNVGLEKGEAPGWLSDRVDDS